MYAKGKRPTNGDLVAIYNNGKRQVIEHDKPFALLQYLKKQYVAPRGGKLKIVYSYN